MSNIKRPSGPVDMKKIPETAATVSALLYLFCQAATGILGKLLAFEGVAAVLADISFWIAVGTGAVCVFCHLILCPGKNDLRHGTFRTRITADYLLLLLLLLLMAVSIVSMQSAGLEYTWWSMTPEILQANLGILKDTAGEILILFPLGCRLARHRNSKAFRIPAQVFVTVFLVLEIWMLIRIFNNDWIYLPNGGAIGIDDQLSLLINCNRNTTGLWGYCFFFLNLWLAVTAAKPLKPLHILGMTVNLLVIALSRSRTSLYANCLMMGLFTAIRIICRKKTAVKKKTTRILTGLLTGAAVTAGLYFLNSLLYRIYLNLSGIEELTGIGASGRVFFDSGMSGRNEIWMTALKTMVQDVRSFLTGVSPVGVYLKMEEAIQRNTYTHNQFLEFGMSCGVPAMAVFITFCVRLFLHSIRVCFRNDDCPLRCSLPSLACFLMLLGNMLESTLFGINYLSGIIFITACGWLTELNREPSLLHAD